MINIYKINKTYWKKNVLKDISFSCHDGEIVTLIGNNGAGKSTLFNIISGFLKPDSGNVYYDKSNVFYEYHKHKKKSGYLLDKPLYIDKLSAKEFLFFIGKLHGMPDSQLKSRVFFLLERFNIPKDNMFIEKYSKGTRQKVSFITAIINSPRFLILDEPFVNMDIDSVCKCQELLVSLRDSGSNIIISSNMVGQLRDMSDKYIILKEGEIILSESAPIIEKEAKQKYDYNDNSFYRYISSLCTN